MSKKNYGLFGFGKQRPPRDPNSRFLGETSVTSFIIVVAIGIALLSIIAGIVAIWYPQVSGVQQQVGLGLLVLMIIASIFIPFTLIRRQFVGFRGSDFVFMMLAIGVLVFLLVVTPKLFNLPSIFTVAKLQLAQTTQSILGFP